MGHSTTAYLFHYSCLPFAESCVPSQFIFNEFHFNLNSALRLFARFWKASMAIIVRIIILQSWGINLFICDFISSVRLSRKSWLTRHMSTINKVHAIHRRWFCQIYSGIFRHRLHRCQIKCSRDSPCLCIFHKRGWTTVQLFWSMR